LLQGEALVNQLNVQAETDAVAEANTEVVEAQVHLTQAQAALTVYRNKEGIIDPKSTSLGGLDLIAKLSTDLAALRAERAGLAASAPQSPQLPGMDNRITAYQQQIDLERSKLVGESSSLSSKISDFERLTFDEELAGKELASAMTALDGSRQEARRKRLYLQRVVEPQLPQSPALPYRFAGFLVFLVSTLMAYAIAKLVTGALKEHRQ
ncbi:MAG: chain-length determining protein, partial [Caulobacteraceae bacterium]|nr:chain-length determining protein [Caulobacteraceae bacterium]